MKYILGVFLAFVLAVGYSFFDIYKKLSAANTLAATLKVKNIKLAKQNAALNANNKKLIAQQKRIHKKISQRRQKLTLTNINKAKKKLATAGAKMAPFLGIPIVIGATVYDINDYCSNIDEMEKFEYDLFGDVALSKYDKTVCGINIEKQLEFVAGSVNSSYNSLLHNFNQNTSYASSFWEKRLDETASLINNESSEFKKYYAEQFIKTSTYLSKQNENISPFWHDQAVEALKYKNKVMNFYFK